LINTSPEPFSNWSASFAEDVAVIGGLWAALSHPWLFLALLVAFILILAWVLPKLWRAIAKLFSKIGRFFRGGAEPNQGAPETATDAPSADKPKPVSRPPG
jgi:hypothetical protein